MNVMSDADIEKVVRLIDEGGAQIQPARRSVVFIGDTGSGKSSLLNYLSGVELVGERRQMGLSYGFVVSRVDGNDTGFVIGQGLRSETTIPHAWEKEGSLYWDCPGFMGNTGHVQNIADAFFIKQIFGVSDSFKIVIVIEASAFEDARGQRLIALLAALVRLFGSAEPFLGCLSLVVTKCRLLPDVEATSLIPNSLQKLLDQVALEPEQTRILRYLISGLNRISVFHSPQEEGPIPAGDRSNILSNLDRVPFIDRVEVRVGIRPETQNEIHLVFNRTHSMMRDELSLLLSSIAEEAQRLIREEQFATLVQLVKPLLFRALDAIASVEELLPLLDAISYTAFDVRLSVIRNRVASLIFFKSIAREQCLDEEKLAVSSVRDLIQPTLDRVLGSLSGTIDGKIRTAVTALEAKVSCKLDGASMGELEKFRDDFLVGKNAAEKSGGGLAALVRAFLEFQLSTDELQLCNDTLQDLRFDLTNINQLIGISFDRIIKEIDKRKAFLTTAQRQIETFSNFMPTYAARQALNAGYPKVDDLLKGLRLLFDGLGSMLANDVVSVAKFMSVRNYKGFPVDLAQRLEMSSVDYPNLIINSATLDVVRSDIGKVSSWIQWYEKLLTVYDYLISSTPPPQFIKGVTKDTFAEFMTKTVPGAQQNLLEKNQSRVQQVNELISSTWNDSDKHDMEVDGADVQILRIVGNCIKISELVSQNRVIKGVTQWIKIEAFSAVYFDQDLDFPGVNMIIVAPHWFIEKSVRINLSGVHAEDHDMKADDGQGVDESGCGRAGEDGLPGLPGQSGGCFYGKGMVFTGLKRLLIEANGGNGGNGQNAGNGSDGLAGENSPAGQSGNGKLGGSGGNAGAGGAAGRAGNFGSVEIWGNMQEITQECTVSCEAGKDGKDGQHGTAGVGGKNGNGWHYSTYSQSYVVGSGKDSRTEYQNVTQSYPVTTDSCAPGGRVAARCNILNQALPTYYLRDFAREKNEVTSDYRRRVKDIMQCPNGNDDVIRKIQRSILSKFVPRIGFGIVEGKSTSDSPYGLLSSGGGQKNTPRKSSAQEKKSQTDSVAGAKNQPSIPTGS